MSVIERTSPALTVSTASVLAGLSPVDGQVFHVLGLMSPGDGNGGTFFYDIDSAASVDGSIVIDGPNSIGRYLRIGSPEGGGGMLPDTNFANSNLASSSARSHDFTTAGHDFTLDVGGNDLMLESSGVGTVSLINDDAGRTSVQATSSGINVQAARLQVAHYDGATAGELRLMEPANLGVNYVSLKAPDAGLAGSVIWTLPIEDGMAGQVISTDGAGNLSFISSGASEMVLDKGEKAGTDTIDLSSGYTIVLLTLIGDYSFAFIDPPALAWLTFVVTQDSTGGHSISWPTLDGDDPWIDGAADAVTIVRLFFDGTNYHSAGY